MDCDSGILTGNSGSANGDNATDPVTTDSGTVNV